MERVRLDQHAAQIQLAEQLPQHRPLVIFASGVAGLADRHTEGSRIQRDLGNVDAVGRRPYAEPPPAVGKIDPRKALPSHTSWSRSLVPPGIWAIVQSRIAAHSAATSTWWKK